MYPHSVETDTVRAFERDDDDIIGTKESMPKLFVRLNQSRVKWMLWELKSVELKLFYPA